ncbi:glycosyltransferase family 39 protein [Paracnuella aquatica]|uniref:glycosyltransferase family 39 protein n=1 Tax=Paracnuella aquatica TaxID=2268757 RepID=UPI000DEFF1E5|nr:glycosyltransferase family 39 protein [Paracnuella aquatica]RPD51751.1 hypothetical protein DRJ53_03470 [Paracnuella aquatica]
MQDTHQPTKKAILLSQTSLPYPNLPHQKSGSGNLLIWIFIFSGIALRLFHYFDNRSLWVDEVYLSSSLIRMNYLELMAPALDYEQKAPIGFLWLVRTAVMLFGKSEMALRLVPLLAGIASLLLFLPLCRQFLKPLGVAVAIGIMALAPPLIYHSVEIKQYSMELLATVLLLLFYAKWQHRHDLKGLIVWGLCGAAVVWFSYASIFILMGMAGAMALHALLNRRWPHLVQATVLGTFWLASFALNYFLFTNKYADSEWLVTWFAKEGGFMPLPPKNMNDVKWYATILSKVFYYPMGLWWKATMVDNRLLQLASKLPLVPLLVIIPGFIAVFKQSRQLFWVLTLPLLLTLAASVVKVYPFYERLLVFLAPLLILFIAYGVVYLTERFRILQKAPYLLPIAVLAVPVTMSTAQATNTALFGDYKKAYHRETLAYINDRFQPGDVVYVYWNVQHTYRYYQEAYPLKFDAVEGLDVRFISADPQAYFRNLAPEFAALKGNKRVWVIYNKFYDLKIGDFVDQPPYYLPNIGLLNDRGIHDAFKSMGREVDAYKTVDVNVYLFDLSQPK